MREGPNVVVAGMLRNDALTEAALQEAAQRDDALSTGVFPVDPFADEEFPGGEPPREPVGAGGPPMGMPDGVPVALWPAELLQQALTGVPGIELTRVVAEAMRPEAELLGDLPDDVLGDLATACGRLQSWAAGLQARTVAERAGRETDPLAHASLVGQVTSELRVTGTEAADVVVRAESGALHPSVISALEAGRIDVKKAHTLLRSASQLTVAERAEAISRYLPQAPARTWRWLRNRMLAFAKSRHGAGETARAAAQHRSVQVDRAENDMAWLSAYLPAVDAAAVWGVVDDMAHQLRHVTGEARDLGQLRADCLTGIVTGRLLPADRFADPDVTTATTDAEPGTTTAPTTAATGTPSLSGTGAATGTATTADDIGAGRTSRGDTEAPVCACGGRAPVVETVHVVRVTPTRPVVRVTIPASVLLGLDDAPGDLAGYGPIPAGTARLIATDATWQRLVTDPVTGILTDYSTTTYQPGKVLRAAVQARDETCTFLTCDGPAVWDDLDHIVPFDHDLDPTSLPTGTPGQTRAHNLHPLCRKHHLLKTHAGWGVVRDPDTGVTTWTTPTGRTSTRPPTVLDTHIELDRIDPDTSYDLTRRALTGDRLPRAYRQARGEPVPGGTTEPGPGRPPF